MNIALVAAGLAGLSALLLIVVLLQIRSLANAVGELASARSTPRGGREDPLHQVFASELKDIADQIGRFDIVFSEVQAQLNAARQAKPAAPAPAAQEAPALAQQVSSPAPVPQRSAWGEEAAPAPSPRPPLVDSDVSSAPAAGGGASAGGEPHLDAALEALQPLVSEYRALIAEPRKNEINRWSDQAGGWACEIQEDGSVRPLAREAGGLLVLIGGSDDVGIIVPGGRLVVDFPTDFANTIAMRRVTREAFELINDGTGVLRITEAAVAKRSGDRWQLVQAGKLAGLKSE
jgi:hypothetical protein